MVPIVSVVMPVRNAERFVSLALASILDQSLHAVEVIVVDDGSEDATAEIVAMTGAGDPRVRLLKRPARGLVAALNEACGLAAAPLIARMDADDVSERNRLEAQVAMLEQARDTVLLGSATTLIDDQGKVVGRRIYPTDPARLACEMLSRNCFAHPTVVFRRSAFEAAGGYRQHFSRAEDYDLWLRLAEHGAIGNTDEPLLRYRIHAGQVTQHHLHEQARSTVAAQAAARARRLSGSEPGFEDLSIDPAMVEACVAETAMHRAAQYLDAGRLTDADDLLTALKESPAHLARDVLVQRARLALRRRERRQAALLLAQACFRTTRKRS